MRDGISIRKIANLAKKTTSFAIVWTMILSSLTGLFIGEVVAPSEGALASIDDNGDIFIGSDYENDSLYIEDRTHYLDANLTVRSGGTVIVENGGLSFTQDSGADGIPGTSDDNVYSLVVEDGGKLILRNSVLTTTLNQLYDIPNLGVIVRNGGMLQANDSTLKFPGHLVVDNSTLEMRNSTLTGHNSTQISTYCMSDYFPADSFQFSPVTLFMSSTVNIYDSTINKLYERGGDTNIYNSTFTFAADDGDRRNVTYNLTRTPSVFAPSNNATGTIDNARTDDLSNVTVAPSEVFATDNIDMAGMTLDSAEIGVVTLHVEYKTDPGYSGTNTFQWGFENGGMTSTSIQPSDTAAAYNTSINQEVVESEALPSMSSTDLSQLNISFANDDPSNNLYIDRVWVTVEFTMQTYQNITISGDTSLTAVNSMITCDYSDIEDDHNSFVSTGGAKAYLYGTYFYEGNVSVGPDRQPALVPSDSSFDATPFRKGPSDDTGSPIANLTQQDGNLYLITDTSTLSVDELNHSGFSGKVEGAVLNVAYSTGAPYVGTDYVQYSTEGTPLKNTSIGIENTGTLETLSFDLYEEGIDTFEKIADLNLTLENSGGGDIYVDKLWIEVTLESSVNIYRWAEVSVEDSQSLPVSGATVNATLQPDDIEAYYYTPEGIATTPPQNVLEYLGKNSSSFKMTNTAGEVLLPLLSEVANEDTLPNTEALGSYDLNVTYYNETGTGYYGETGVSFNLYPAMGLADQTEDVEKILTDLVLEKPDLLVSSIAVDPSTVYEGEIAEVTATVENIGLTSALNFTVVFYDFNAEMEQEIGNATIGELAYNSSVNVTIEWNSTTPAGSHTVTVMADADKKLLEKEEDNNLNSVQVEILAHLPDLSIQPGDINITPQPGYTESEITAEVTVRNTNGLENAVNAEIEFYFQNPDEGGTLIGTTTIDVATGGSNTTTFSWIPNEIGDYPIYVSVNRDRSIMEYDYTNNTAFKNITVELTVDPDFDLIVEDENTTTITGGTSPFPCDSNIVVRKNGTLVIDSASLRILQNSHYQYRIVVSDNGTLWLNDATIFSTYSFELYLFDNSSLVVNDSTLETTMKVIANDDSTMDITGSTIKAELIAPTSSNTVLTAMNTTFTKSWSSFGGNAVAHLTSVSSPNLSITGNATVYHYRWLDITVLDGTGAVLPDAYVGVHFYFNNTLYASGMTDSDGKLLIQALSDIITPSKTKFVGNYMVNATFWFDGDRYDSESPLAVSLDPYSKPLFRNDIQIAIQIESALPDLDPPFYVSDDTPYRGQNVTLSANVSNVGVVPANDVVVRFEDNGSLIRDVVVDTLSPGETVTVESWWIADYPIGEHNLSVTVDPNGLIPEMDTTNNENYTLVNVYGTAEFVLLPSDITTDPSSLSENHTVTVSIVVKNIGDLAATDVRVDLYESWEGAPSQLVGYDEISVLSAGDSAVAVIMWTPTDYGNYTLTAVVDEPDIIEEPSEDNNMASISLYVERDYRPDFKFVGPLIVSADDEAVANASVGELVELSCEVKNDGLASSLGLEIAFHAVDIDGLHTVIGSVYSDFQAGETVTANISWAVNVTSGDYDLMAVLNPGHQIEERDYSNDNITTSFEVKPPVPSIIIDLGGVYQYNQDTQILVRGDVTNEINDEPLAGVTVVVTLRDSTGSQIGDNRTVTTSSSGHFETAIYLPPGIEGNYEIEVGVQLADETYTDAQPINVTPTFEPSSLPWWVWVLIIGAVASVIIGFSAYLYRYGLGQMVECGECGALIPESSKKCPNCGTEFEKGTSKCSECGAWIPATSTSCPECGVQFVGEAIGEEEGEYMKKMRRQYEEMVEEHKERAKEELGDKYSESKFLDWWKKQPSYVTFEEWLTQEEERKKGAFPCPVCETLNPRGATICHKCGTVFDQIEKEGEEEEKPSKGKRLRRIIRKPVKKEVDEEGGAEEEEDSEAE